MKHRDEISKSIYYQLADIVEITAIFVHGDSLVYRARPKIELVSAKKTIAERLTKSGFSSNFQDESYGFLIYVKQVEKFKIPIVNIVLFILSLTTMFFSILFLYSFESYPAIIKSLFSTPDLYWGQIFYTASLGSILLFHEFGHYFAGKRRGVFMSLPYFLPAPNFAGTFGAIIKSRSPITNRRDLIEVGAAGPIAGFVIAIIVFSIGLSISEFYPDTGQGSLLAGDSLLTNFLKMLFVDPTPEGMILVYSPVAKAGWVGILVTMLNLLPMGQLDGGHIIYGLFGRNQHIAARMMAGMLFVLGFWWKGWWFFGALVFFFGLNHPPTIEDDKPIGSNARIIGIVAILIFIVSFTPVPFGIE